MKKLTTEEYIKKARLVHGDKYGYSLVEYVGRDHKVKIICEKHGVFEQNAGNHLSRCECPECANEINPNIKMDAKTFIEKARLVHGDKYDYSLIKYIKSDENVVIVCPKHGEYLQKPKNHLCGYGCQKCAGKNRSTDDYIYEAKLVHGDKYDYSLVNYKDTITKIKIVCCDHGMFTIRPSEHLFGYKCPKCNKMFVNTKSFIKRAKLVHDDKYDYSLVDYVNAVTKIKIICPKHGTFMQRSGDHLVGRGCPHCNESKGELVITNYLKTKGFEFIREKKYDNCRGYKRTLPFDFYLPDYNALVEYDGEQHFKPLKYWGGEEGFNRQQINDNIKNEYAKNNNINLLRIRFDEYKNINEILDKNIKTWQTQLQM